MRLALPAGALVPVLALLAFPLHAQTTVTIPGQSAGDNFGFAVDGAGDVNGDGTPDVVVGAPFDDTGIKINNGTASVRSGLDGTPIWSFEGAADFDLFGRSVAGLGDLDGDGFPEVAVGAFFSDVSGPESGSIYIYSGGGGGLLTQVNGPNSNDQFGQSIAGLGDVNGDGLLDFAVGAWSGSGFVRVYNGPGATHLYDIFGTGDDALGTSVAGPGDVNNDGFADVAAGGYLGDAVAFDGGVVKIVSGPTGSVLYTHGGLATGDQFGISVGRAGDVDGDGYADVVIGANYEDSIGGGVDSGVARVFSGFDGSILHTFEGLASADRLGGSVGGGADFDGDSVPDVLAGAAGADSNGADAGSAYAFSGLTGATIRTWNGDAAGDALGIDVADAGPGRTAVGAFKSDVGGGDSGLVKIFVDCAGSITSYGSGCPGSGGFTPALALSGCPAAGAFLQGSISGGLGGSTAVLLFGAGQGSAAVGAGCSIDILPLLPAAIAVPLGGAGPGNGSVNFGASLPGALPPALSFTLQSYVIDPASPIGASLTNAVLVTIP